MLSASSNAVLSAVFWCAITLAVYLASLFIFRRLGSRPIFHPMVFCIAILAVILFYTGVSVEGYQAKTGLLTWLLGPATVALAIPLYSQLSSVKQNGVGVLLPIVIGGLLAPILALLVVYFLPMEAGVKLSLLTKSITTSTYWRYTWACSSDRYFHRYCWGRICLQYLSFAAYHLTPSTRSCPWHSSPRHRYCTRVSDESKSRGIRNLRLMYQWCVDRNSPACDLLYR